MLRSLRSTSALIRSWCISASRCAQAGTPSLSLRGRGSQLRERLDPELEVGDRHIGERLTRACEQRSGICLVSPSRVRRTPIQPKPKQHVVPLGSGSCGGTSAVPPHPRRMQDNTSDIYLNTPARPGGNNEMPRKGKKFI
jgi:hypothetical protein